MSDAVDFKDCLPNSFWVAGKALKLLAGAAVLAGLAILAPMIWALASNILFGRGMKYYFNTGLAIALLCLAVLCAGLFMYRQRLLKRFAMWKPFVLPERLMASAKVTDFRDRPQDMTCSAAFTLWFDSEDVFDLVSQNPDKAVVMFTKLFQRGVLDAENRLLPAELERFVLSQATIPNLTRVDVRDVRYVRGLSKDAMPKYEAEAAPAKNK